MGAGPVDDDHFMRGKWYATPIDGREKLALGFVVKALEVGLGWGAFLTGCHINEARVSHTRAHGDDRGIWIGYQVLQCVGLFRYPGDPAADDVTCSATNRLCIQSRL